MRRARLLKDAQTDATKLKYADQARTEGDLQAACRIYVRLAGTRAANPATAVARQRLAELQQEARQKLADVQAGLAQLDAVSPSEQTASEWNQQLVAYVSDFDDLAKQYRWVPQVGRDIKSSLRKQKQRPRVQSVLREPDAKRLWDLGQELEGKGQVCCAFQAYKKAIRHLPAPSARIARKRLDQLKSDPANIAAAEDCRTLQWCHKKYKLAMLVVQANPRQARVLFEQIVDKSPADSPVHEAAQSQISRLN